MIVEEVDLSLAEETSEIPTVLRQGSGQNISVFNQNVCFLQKVILRKGLNSEPNYNKIGRSQKIDLILELESQQTKANKCYQVMFVSTSRKYSTGKPSAKLSWKIWKVLTKSKTCSKRKQNTEQKLEKLREIRSAGTSTHVDLKRYLWGLTRPSGVRRWWSRVRRRNLDRICLLCTSSTQAENNFLGWHLPENRVNRVHFPRRIYKNARRHDSVWWILRPIRLLEYLRWSHGILRTFWNFQMSVFLHLPPWYGAPLVQ